jgi:DNA relaxase NicK
VIAAVRSELVDRSEAEAAVPMKSFKHAVQFESGVKISWHEDFNHAHVLLKGEGCTALGVGLLAHFITAMSSIGRCCRIDLNIDVAVEKALDPSTFDDWREKGYTVGYKRFQTHKDYGRKEGTGYTFAAGSRGSNGGGKHFRSYRKAIGDSTVYNYVRYEIEFSGDRAIKVAEEISGIPRIGLEGLHQYIESTVLGSIDFKEEGDTRHTGRRKRLEAWSKFVHSIRLNRVSTGRRIKPPKRTREALKRQYSRFLYEHAKNHPEDYLSLLSEIRQLGKEKSERKQLISAQCRAELKLYVHGQKVQKADLIERLLLEQGSDPTQVADWLKEGLYDSLMRHL